jgi:hypothetical protein
VIVLFDSCTACDEPEVFADAGTCDKCGKQGYMAHFDTTGCKEYTLVELCADCLIEFATVLKGIK